MISDELFQMSIFISNIHNLSLLGSLKKGPPDRGPKNTLCRCYDAGFIEKVSIVLFADHKAIGGQVLSDGPDIDLDIIFVSALRPLVFGVPLQQLRDSDASVQEHLEDLIIFGSLSVTFERSTRSL